MASAPNLVRYITDQMAEAGAVAARKMFGEYGLYIDGIFFAMVCDDRLFVKITEAARAACPGLPQAPPYPGAKDYLFVENVDDRALLCRLARASAAALAPRAERRKPHGQA